MADFWRVATGNWDALLSWSQIGSGGAAGVGNPTAADNAIFDTNTPSGTHTINVAATCLNFDLDKPSSGTLSFAGSSALAISGNLIVRSATNISRGTYTGAITFNATSAGFTIQSNGLTWASAFTFAPSSGTSGAWTLQDAFSTTGTLTHTAGTLDTGGFSVTSSTNACSNANTRTLTITNSTWTTTATGTFWTTATTTGLTLNVSGSTIVNNATGARTPNFAAAVNNVSIGGNNTVTTSGGPAIFGGVLDFTGYTGQWQNSAQTLKGNVIFGAGMTTEAGSSVATFSPTSGTVTIDTKGVAWNQPITVNAAGATVQLINNDLDTGSHAFILTAGTFDLNSKSFSCTTNTSSNANARTIAFGTGGVFMVTAAAGGTVWNMATSTNAAITGTGTIKITCNSATQKSFSGGGLTYPNLWIADAGAGEARLVGSSNFADIKVDDGRGMFPTAGTTTHYTSLTVNGTAGLGITIASANGSTSTHALVKDGADVVSGDYLTISHSVATPANTHYAGANSTNNQGTATAGSGWIFTVPPSSRPVKMAGNWGGFAGRSGGFAG